MATLNQTNLIEKETEEDLSRWKLSVLNQLQTTGSDIEKYEKQIKKNQDIIVDMNKQLELLEKEYEVNRQKYDPKYTSFEYKKIIDDNLLNINNQIEQFKISEKNTPLTLKELDLLEKLYEQQLIAYNDINDWNSNHYSCYPNDTLGKIRDKYISKYNSKTSQLTTDSKKSSEEIQKLFIQKNPFELRQITLKKKYLRLSHRIQKASQKTCDK